MLCFALINCVLLNLSCVWVLKTNCHLLSGLSTEVSAVSGRGRRRGREWGGGVAEGVGEGALSLIFASTGPTPGEDLRIDDGLKVQALT